MSGHHDGLNAACFPLSPACVSTKNFFGHFEYKIKLSKQRVNKQYLVQ